MLFVLTDILCKTTMWIENMHQFWAVYQTAAQPHLSELCQFLGG